MNTQTAIISGTMQLANSNNHLQPMSSSAIETIDAAFDKLGYVTLRKNNQGVSELAVDNATYEILARLLWQFQMLYEEFHEQKWYHQELYSVGE